MFLYSNFVNFKVIKLIDVIKSNEWVPIEYKFSNKIYLLLKPTDGYAKKMSAHKRAVIEEKL